MEGQSTLDLKPESWKYKTDSGYSVTEGMEYEVFTEGFRQLYGQIQSKKEQAREMLLTDVFLENGHFQMEEEEVRQYLFQESKREGKREEETTSFSAAEIILGSGVMVLLFFLLVRITFLGKKNKKKGEKTGWKTIYR